MKFKKGREKTGGKVKGSRHRLTLIREQLGLKRIEDFRPELLEVWAEFLGSSDRQERMFALRELSKYVFPQKRQIDANLAVFSIDDLILQNTKHAEVKDEHRGE